MYLMSCNTRGLELISKLKSFGFNTSSIDTIVSKGKVEGTAVKPVIANQPAKNTREEFDKLPSYVAGQKTMTYAGIGSRETPIEVQKEMYKAAKMLESMGYTLQSGGAIGADKAFQGASQPWKKADGTVAGTKEFTRSRADVVEWARYGNDRNSTVTNAKIFRPEDANGQVRKIAKEIHPKGEKLSSSNGLDLHARNTFQIFGAALDTPVDFVLFYAKETKGIRPEGGTGQAVEMARLKGIPTINMAEDGWESKLDSILGNKEAKKSTGAPVSTSPTNHSSNEKSGTTKTESTVEMYGDKLVFKGGSTSRTISNVQELISVSKDIKEALKIPDDGNDEFFINTINKLLTLDSKASVDKFTMVIANTGILDDNRIGNWNLSTNTLSIDPNRLKEFSTKPNGNMFKVIAHEFAHTVTMEAIRDGKNAEIVKKLETLRKYAITKLAEKNNTSENEVIKNFYGLQSNVDEFVAETLTSPKLQVALNSISSSTSIVGKVQELFKGLLYKLVGKDAPTTLNEALSLIAELKGMDVAYFEVKERTDKKSYSMGNGRTTNQDQTNAVNALLEWFDGNEPTFLLKGRGGTGKTATINAFVAELMANHPELDRNMIVVVAPSHAALGVIAEANKGSQLGKSEHKTLASFLEKTYKYEAGTDNKKWAGSGEGSVRSGGLAIVDEASFISKEDYESLVNGAKKGGYKIVFMGDEGQLPPVKSESPESPVFTDHYNKENEAELVQQMRQSEGNKMAELLDLVYGLTQKVIKARREGNTNNNTTYADLLSEIKELVHTPGQYVNGEGLLSAFDGQMDAVLNEFVKDFAENPNSTKMITANNEYHKSTIERNMAIRRKLLANGVLSNKDNAKIETIRFMENEPILFGETNIGMRDNNDKYGSAKTFRTSATGIVKKVVTYDSMESAVNAGAIMYSNYDSVSKEHFPTEFTKEMLNTITSSNNAIRVYVNGELKELNGNDIISALGKISVVTFESDGKEYNVAVPSDLDLFTKIITRLDVQSRTSSSLDVKNKYKTMVSYLSESLAPVYLGYQIGVHKAQGSSFDNVYMLTSTISNSVFAATSEANRMDSNTKKLETIRNANEGAYKSLYVGVSRPKKKLVMVMPGSGNGTLTNIDTKNNGTISSNLNMNGCK